MKTRRYNRSVWPISGTCQAATVQLQTESSDATMPHDKRDRAGRSRLTGLCPTCSLCTGSWCSMGTTSIASPPSSVGLFWISAAPSQRVFDA